MDVLMRIQDLQGGRRIYMKKTIEEADKHYDVIICGAGPSGVAAAVAAARSGVRTLLLEKEGYAGGMATSALVNPWSGHEYPGAHSVKAGSIIGGFFKEVCCRLAEGGGLGSLLTTYAFDEELLKIVYDELLAEAGVIVRYHSVLSGAQTQNGELHAVNVFSKSGAETFYGKTFIDATGDGDLAAFAGCRFSVGRPSDGLTQAMTTSFRMANVDKSQMLKCTTHREARQLVDPIFQQAIKDGSLYYPYRNFIHFYDYPRAGVLHFNMTRINEVSGLSTVDLSRAEREGRRQARIMSEWLIANHPAFKHAYLEKVAPHIGVRETRHIHGLYTFTHEDITAGRKFKDAVARSTYFIDIHNPKGSQDIHQSNGGKGAVKSDYAPPKGDWYEIPFRCLLTEDCPNLVVPCRALSASHEASAAIRVLATMHALGEAAGKASAQALKIGKKVLEVPGEWLREQTPWLEEAPEYGYPWDNATRMRKAAGLE